MNDDDPHARLVDALCQLRSAVGGATLAELEECAARQGAKLRPQTLSPVLRGERLPSLNTLKKFLVACRKKAELERIKVPPELFSIAVYEELLEQCRAAHAATADKTSSAVDRSRATVVVEGCTGVMTGDYSTLQMTVNQLP